MIALMLVGSSWAQDVPPPSPAAGPPASEPAPPGASEPSAPSPPAGPAADPTAGPAADPADGPAADPADGPAADPAGGPAGEPGSEAGDPDAPAAPTSDPAGVPEPAPVVEVPQWKELRLLLAVEGSSLANPDPAYDLFSDGDGMGGIGLRLGVRPLERIELRGAWHRIRRGATVTASAGGTGGTDSTSTTDADFASNDLTFQSAFTAHLLTGGLRADVSLGDVFFPYVVGEATLMSARVRLDDDPTTRTNPGQVQETGVTTGLGALGGVELRTPPGKARLQVGWTLEMGYTWLAAIQLGDLGQMQPGGYTVRSGVALHL